MNSTTQRIVFTTEVRGIVRRTPKEEAAQREIMAVALAQPHRRGSDDPRMATPLGRFVEKTWGHKASIFPAIAPVAIMLATSMRRSPLAGSRWRDSSLRSLAWLDYRTIRRPRRLPRNRLKSPNLTARSPAPTKRWSRFMRAFPARWKGSAAR